MRRIYSVINEALKVWVDATGEDPNKNALAGIWTGVYDANRDIQKAQELDPSGVTTFMIIRSSARAFASEQTFDALQFLENPNAVLKDTSALRKLLKLLNDPECVAEVQAFQDSLRVMAREYGIAAHVKELIDDIQELAYIRRDAILGYRELKGYRFAQGKRGSGPARYNRHVLKFWNINSAIRAARVQLEDGVSMVMLRDPVAEFSCFAFLIRNGENIDVLTDISDVPHPLHKHMSRSAGRSRSYEARAFRLRFPYGLFAFEFADDGRFKREVPTNGLVKINTEAVRVKEVKKLPPDEALWAMMMFDLIRQKHWIQDPESLPLSYTGESTLLLNGPKNGPQAVSLPNTIKLPDLKREDIHRDKLKDNWEREATGQNDWMEDRYAQMVPEKVFNVIGNDGVKLLSNGEKVKERDVFPRMKERPDQSLVAVDPMAFGTPEEMDRDRRFIARYNQAVVINAHAAREFQRREEDVKNWYDSKVRANLPFLMDCVAKGSLVSEVQRRSSTDSFDCEVDKGSILTQWMAPNARSMGKPWYFRAAQIRLYSGGSVYRCFLDQKPVSVWTLFTPMTPVSVALLAGCQTKDLPDVLRHWCKNERYYGNPILDRLDPMDWKCKNPWRELDFDILIGLSKRSFNKLLKDRGLKKRNPPMNQE